MKTILITGGGGFIGKNLITYLINNGICSKIVVIDNFITSNKTVYLRFLNKYKYTHIVETIHGDICNNLILDTMKQLYVNIDEIYHLASLGKNFSLESLDVGYIGTKNILELCLYYKRINKECKILYTSTSEIYGENLKGSLKLKETSNGNLNNFNETSCFAESKRVAESLCLTYMKQYALDIKIVRIFNTYGPHMNTTNGNTLTDIIRSLLFGSTLQIEETGNQTRSICYVDDTIKMMIKIMNSDHHSPVNIGSEQEITVDELVELCKKIFINLFKEEYNVSPVYADTNVYNQLYISKPCLQLNKKIIGDFSFTPLELGLKNTFLHLKESIECK